MAVKGGYQPYSKRQPRHPGLALRNMLRGRTAAGTNPMDVERRTKRRQRPRAARLPPRSLRGVGM